MRRMAWGVKRLTGVLASGLACVGCGGSGDGNAFDQNSGTSSGASSSGSTAPASVGEAGTSTGRVDSGSSEGGEIKLDIVMPDIDPFEPPEPTCKVVDGMDAIGECDLSAPPDSFEPDVQWTWDGGSSLVTPMVANLTDDNADGSIDLCDIPDIVVVTAGLGGTLTVLDGETGAEHFSVANVQPHTAPAVGDIDGDGEAEIVTTRGGLFGPMAFVAFDTDGTQLWVTDNIWEQDSGGAVAIADMDNDGSPEIIGDGHIVSADGTVLFSAPPQVGWLALQRCTATIAVDLDGDDDLEIVLGQSAYHHDGTEIWNDESIRPGFPQVANLDGDDDPEIIINHAVGITILEHDGTSKYVDMAPTGDVGIAAWFRPSTVHDFDGDEVSEFAVSSAASYSVFEPNLTISWTATVDDSSGWAAGTAFDFLGDGVAEAMYADEQFLFVYGADGSVELQVPRSSRTIMEYPVVADVDNDGSAEIVIVSGSDFDGKQTAPTVQVIRDMDDRWIQARRIWNQHAYHVTNVREDGTIPATQPKSWQLLNTFRTNAQIENGSVCKPQPEG